VDTLPWARRTLVGADLETQVIWWWEPQRRWPQAGWRRSLLYSPTAPTRRDLAWADYRSWTPHAASRGWLAIHDVFAGPGKRGQTALLSCTAKRSDRACSSRTPTVAAGASGCSGDSPERHTADRTFRRRSQVAL